MLKRIRTDQLRSGMYLHELCGSWMDNPFWRKHLLLADGQAVERVKRSAIREVIIDTERGLDVLPDVEPARVEEADIEAAPVTPQPSALPEEIVAVGRDYHAAAALCRRSMDTARQMFQQARQGRPLDGAQCEAVVREVFDSVMASPATLISLARLKRADSYTYMHAIAGCALMITLARQMELTTRETEEAGLAGLLIDCGKARMPTELLDRPSRVSERELGLLHSHARRGHELLVKAGGFGPRVLGAVLHHHERFDGSGYPDRLSGEDIPLTARMAAVCDVYDAVTSRRPYRGPWDPGEAMRHLAQAQGQFDPIVFQSFVKAVGVYPTGALVRMQSERLGVVTAPSAGSLLTPKVKLFYSVDERHMIDPFELDLADASCGDRITGVESPEAWRFPGLERLWLGGTAEQL